MNRIIKNKRLLVITLLFLSLIIIVLCFNYKKDYNDSSKHIGNSLEFVTSNIYNNVQNKKENVLLYKEEIKFDNDSKDIIILDNPQTTNVNVNVTNKSNTDLYYRTFIFDGFSQDKNNLKQVSNCILYSQNTNIGDEIEINEESREKLMLIRIYSSSISCLKDSDSESGEFISENSQKIGLKSEVYKYSNEWKLLNFDLDGIKNDIGLQSPMLCHDYALAYGVYIISNGKKISTVFPRNSVCYGSKISVADSMEELFETIKNKIDNGIPTSIHVNNNSGGEHWVLVVGYRSGIDIKNCSADDFYVLDPGNLFYGQLDKNFRDTQYRTWVDRDSAVACR